MKKVALMVAVLMMVVVIVNAVAVEWYPHCGVVVEVNYNDDTVAVEDANGEIWVFEGCEDWEVGDICAMIMDTNGTETIYDDIIVDCRYCGWVD